MKKYLVVVDMQNDFVDGVLGTKEAVVIIPYIREKIAGFTGEVLFTRDTHQADYLNTQEGRNLPVVHCIKDSKGWEIIPQLSEYTKDRAVYDNPSFGSLELAEFLRACNEKEKIESVELVGVCTDICVISNAMLIKAAVPETKVIVWSEGCAGVSVESHNTALQAMKACQVEIR